jgi:hypothetical protein
MDFEPGGSVQVLVYKKLTAPRAQLVTWRILLLKISTHEFFDTYSIVVYCHKHKLSARKGQNSGS